MNDLRDKIRANTIPEIRQFLQAARMTLPELDRQMCELFMDKTPSLPNDTGSVLKHITMWEIWLGRLDGCEECFASVERAIETAINISVSMPGSAERELPRNTVVSAYAYFQAVSEGAIATLRLNRAYRPSH